MDAGPNTPRIVGRLVGLLVATVGALALLLSPAGVARADNSLSSASPAADSTIDSSPSSIAMNFSQPLGQQNQVGVVCESQPQGIGSPSVSTDALTLTVAVPNPLPTGTCQVAWTVSAQDGSPNGQGVWSFTIGGATTTTAAPTTDPPDTATATTGAGTTVATPDDGGGDGDGGGDSDGSGGSNAEGPLGVGRLVGTLGLAVLFGALLLIGVAWPEGVEYILTVRFLRTAWIVAVLGVYVWTAGLAADAAGSGFGSALLPTNWSDLTDSTAGLAAIARMILTAACGWVVVRPERVIDPNTQLISLAIPGLAVATMGFDRAGDLAALGYITGVLHVLGMAVWLGGLVLLARVVLAGPGEEDLVHAVRGFGRLSNPALMVTVVTGAIQTFRLDRGAIFSTGHGRVLLLKALAVAAMVFVGLATRQFINARLSRTNAMTAPMASRLRRAVGIEAMIGVLVLVLTAWMMSFVPQTIADSEGSSTPDLPAEAVIRDQGLDVTVSLSQVLGPNAVMVEVAEPESGLTGLQVVFTPPTESASGPITLDVPLSGRGTAFLPIEQGVPLNEAGTWTITVRAGGADIGSKNISIS